MIKGAIFDFDGTLFDSMYVWHAVGEEYLKSHGKIAKPGFRDTVKSMSLLESAYYVIDVYGIEKEAQTIADEINGLVEAHYFNDVQPKKGLVNFLKELKADGVKLCIATATDKYMIEAALKRCGIAELFSGIFTCTEVGASKKEPTIYREALKFLGTSRENTMVFEDAIYAVKTAKADGFYVTGIYDIYEKETLAVEEIADLYVRDYEDMNLFREFVSKI
ncbi:MAG: HAD family phosphatase [Clostridia bacterium]|nr:HAD family phosphatase [Clostridia bacterium]